MPVLFVFMGLAASGKSALAKTWANKHDFSYFKADAVRRQLSGTTRPGKPVPKGEKPFHDQKLAQRTYEALLTYAEQEIEKGKSVVLDASYASRPERDRLLDFAERLDTTAYFILCYCSEEETKRRLASQATGWDQFKRQEQELDPVNDLEPTMVVSINTEAPMDQLIEQLDFAFEKKPPVKVEM